MMAFQVSEETIKIVLFITMSLDAVVGFTVWSRFLAILRELHPDEWVSLGRPTMVLGNTPGNSWAAIRFVFSGRYRALQNGRLNRLAALSVGCSVIMLLLLIAFTLVDWW